MSVRRSARKPQAGNDHEARRSRTGGGEEGVGLLLGSGVFIVQVLALAAALVVAPFCLGFRLTRRRR